MKTIGSFVFCFVFSFQVFEERDCKQILKLRYFSTYERDKVEEHFLFFKRMEFCPVQYIIENIQLHLIFLRVFQNLGELTREFNTEERTDDIWSV